MLKTTFKLLFLFLGLSAGWPVVTLAADSDLSIDVSESYFVKENYLQRDDLERYDSWEFRRDQAYNLVRVRPNLSVQAAKGLYGHLGADVTLQNPVPEDEGDELEAEITCAYVSLKGRHVTADLGLQSVQLGNAFILADDTWAASIVANSGNAYAELLAAQVMDRSPMVGLTLGVRPGYFEHVELFGIWYSDQDDTFAESVPFIYQVLYDLKSEGTLYYFGAAADLFVGDALLSVVGAYQTGHYTLNYRTVGGQTGASENDVHAYFGDISLEKNLSDWFTAGLFCFVASGDDQFKGGELECFVSILPYNPRATIFFDPDLLDINDAERLIYGGGFFGGVIAPGLNLTLVSDRGLTFEAALIYLYADKALADDSQWYGWEVDLGISYTFRDRYTLFCEAARFEHGDYYASLFGEKPDPAVRFSAGLRAFF